MRVSHISGSASSLGGGISMALQALAKAQAEAGLQASVVGLNDGGEALAGWPDGMFHELPARRLPGMLWSPLLAGKIRALKPDILHSHGLWGQPSVTVPRSAGRLRAPYLVSPHGMLDRWALENSRWKKRLAEIAYERANLRGAACLHALCQSEADSIRAYGLKAPVCVIPNGVELPEGKKVEGLKVESRGLEEGKILLFLGRVHPKKGLVNALRAWGEVRGRRSKVEGREEWTFVIAGWDQGGHEAELKQLCDELDLSWSAVPASELITDHCSLGTSSSVIFTGPAFGETKDRLLRSASAFILPSFSEGLPMSVLEAWAYRLPVVMTDHCNLPEGFAAEAAIRIGTDAESIAQGIFSLLSAPSTALQAMGGNGRALVEERFTWERIAEQMKEVYEWLVGGGERLSW